MFGGLFIALVIGMMGVALLKVAWNAGGSFARRAGLPSADHAERVRRHHLAPWGR
ncbi:MAG: hypothetical protein LBG11_07500 [Bifidobacteriaceae bacterium]|nr:hypothetical protein [Bifidobacteriaceae bacterium]